MVGCYYRLAGIVWRVGIIVNLSQALLEHWPRPYTLDEESDMDSQGGQTGRQGTGNEYFSVPGHTPVIFSEVGGRTLYR